MSRTFEHTLVSYMMFYIHAISDVFLAPGVALEIVTVH